MWLLLVSRNFCCIPCTLHQLNKYIYRWVKKGGDGSNIYVGSGIICEKLLLATAYTHLSQRLMQNYLQYKKLCYSYYNHIIIKHLLSFMQIQKFPLILQNQLYTIPLFHLCQNFLSNLPDVVKVYSFVGCSHIWVYRADDAAKCAYNTIYHWIPLMYIA